MKITEPRANDILHWLDDETGNHALLFEKMTLHRDAAALIRQLQAELQDAWQAGLDEGRAQGRGDHAHPSPSVEVDANELAGVRARLKPGDYDGADVMRAWLAIDKLLAQQPPSAPVGVLAQRIEAYHWDIADKPVAAQFAAELRSLAHPSPSAPVGVVAMQPVAEIAMSDDGYKIGLLGPLRAHRLPLGTKLYASPEAALAQQPAAVDGVVVRKVAKAINAEMEGTDDVGGAWKRLGSNERRLRDRMARAALAAQPGGSDNDH